MTQTHQNSVRHTGEIDPGRYRPIVCVCVCLFVPPVDEYSHQYQQTEDGESGDDSQRNDRPLLPLHTSDQPDPRLMAAVAAL